MRIFYAGQISPHLNSVGSRIWEINILESLRASHEVILPKRYVNIYDAEKDGRLDQKEFLEENSETLFAEVLAAHREKKIDLFLSYFYSANIKPDVLARIRELGIVTMNMYFNALHQFDLVREIAPLFDFCLVPEKEAMETYRQVGAHPVRFPMAANPSFYKPQDLAKEFDVVFIGSRYLNREAYVSYLYRQGIDAHVFGPDWAPGTSSPSAQLPPAQITGKIASAIKLLKQGSLSEMRWVIKRNLAMIIARLRPSSGLPASNIHPALSDQEMVEMYSRAKIVLNFSETMILDNQYRGKVRNIIKLRDFEVPMSGGFAITGCQEELKEYYRIDSEIVCYRSKQDLLRKVRYYLAHGKERDAISRAGHERALRDHTWKKRFTDAFRETKIEA